MQGHWQIQQCTVEWKESHYAAKLQKCNVQGMDKQTDSTKNSRSKCLTSLTVLQNMQQKWTNLFHIFGLGVVPRFLPLDTTVQDVGSPWTEVPYGIQSRAEALAGG